jgi:hypothetical protein
MFFNQKVNIKILLQVFIAGCLLTAFSCVTVGPALEKGDDTDFLLALFFRIPTQGYSWDFLDHLSGSEKLVIITSIFLLSVIMERMISYARLRDEQRNQEDNS